MSSQSMFRIISFVTFVTFVTLLISACGGGGGDNSGGGGPQLTGGSGLSVSDSSLTTTLDQNGNQRGSGISVSWTNSIVTEVLVGMPPGVSKPSWLDLDITGNTSPVNVFIGVIDTNLPVGVYQTTIRVVTVNVQTPMDFVDVAVSINIVERPSANPTSLTINMVEGIIPASQNVTLSRPGNTVTIYPSTFVSGFNQWADYTINGESVELTINNNALSLATGQYSSSLEIDYNGGRWSIPLTLNVSSAINAPASVTFDINQNSLPGDKTTNITVASNIATPINWTANFSEAWMTLSTTSGDTTTLNNLTLTLNQTELDNMRSGSYAGSLTLSSTDPNVSDVEVPVSLNITIPEVSFVSPYQAVSNTSEEVIIRGSGFQSLVNPVVAFGANNATSSTVISDTEIRTTHGTLTAGQYPVVVTDNSGTLTSFASLTVSDAPTYSPVWISYPTIRVHDNLVYDMDKKALFFRKNSQFDGALQRYQFNGTNWILNVTSDTALTYGAVALDPEGETFYAHTITTHILGIDTTSLAKTDLLNTGNGYNSASKSAAMANNGKMLIARNFSSQSAIYTSDVAIDGSTTVESLYNSFSDSANRISKGSLNGNRVYFVSQNNNAFVRYYDASSEQLITTALSVQASSISVDRDGDRIIFGSNVYNGNMNFLGTLPLTQANVISADGMSAYTFDSDVTGATFRKFDLTSPDGSGGFNEVGTGTQVSGNAVTSPQMTISQDGGTLFVIGEATFIVQPAP